MEQSPRIGDDVRRLIADHVDSLEKLELLALLAERPREVWTLEAAAAAICLPVVQLRRAMDELRAAGLVRTSPGKSIRIELAPATPQLASACGALCDAYAADRIAILKLTNAIALDRVRESAASAFARAFQIRRRREAGEDDDE